MTRQAAALLRRAGVPLLALQGEAQALSGLDVTFLPQAEAFRTADLILTVGGDGTLLRAAPNCVQAGKPVLGVNLGRTGFLATCEVEEMPEKLARLAAGDFALAPRSLLCAAAPSMAGRACAQRCGGFRRFAPATRWITPFFATASRVSRFRSDGLIVATPTGCDSLLFFGRRADFGRGRAGDGLNAGLPPRRPQSAARAGGAAQADHLAESENRTDVTACTDSQNPCRLPPGARIEVTVAPQKLQLVSFGSADQFRAIENKLMRR